MSDLTTEKAAELRKPFPASVIGKLPKAGVMLDFVGHAAVTDRLLQVDPAWTWEPFATDEAGLPAIDKAGNLWIRLTICGVTKPGVGDGPTAKEKVGDALRNAAMRFGVALDLWSKTDLESASEANGNHSQPAPVPPLVAARGRAWTASRRVEPGLMDDERKAWIEGELKAIGTTVADADSTAWNQLAADLESR